MRFGAIQQVRKCSPQPGLNLQDPDDDVRAVAAEALFPVASQLSRCDGALPKQIVRLLWDALLDVDDLSPSIGKNAALKPK